MELSCVVDSDLVHLLGTTSSDQSVIDESFIELKIENIDHTTTSQLQLH